MQDLKTKPPRLCAAVHRDVDRQSADRNRVVRIESPSLAVADEGQEQDHESEEEEKAWIIGHVASEKEKVIFLLTSIPNREADHKIFMGRKNRLSDVPQSENA